MSWDKPEQTAGAALVGIGVFCFAFSQEFYEAGSPGIAIALFALPFVLAVLALRGQWTTDRKSRRQHLPPRQE